MHSLRTRLFGLWGLSLAACVAVGFLLLQLYQQSTEAQVGRAEAVVARLCDLIRDRYGFYAIGWSGPEPGQLDSTLRSDLATAVGIALANQAGVEGGVWQSDAGPMAYAFPTYEGTGPKTDLPTAERDQIQAVNQQAADLKRVVDLAKGLPAGSVDFAVLPGDNADDGTPEQFRLVRDAVAALPMQLHILPGDHDFKPRALDAFHCVLGAERLPKAVTVRGHRCLFLDVGSAGSGDPDFRLGKAQLVWAERELELADSTGRDAVVFMHTYPADLRGGAEQIGALLAKPHVACVDMGHTHYNALANDGATIFMATRSTGQIEEGPAGFSIVAIDRGGVSWRFKALEQAWPFVLVTSPVDRRLVVNADQVVRGPFTARAKVVGDAPVNAIEVQVDNGEWTAMSPAPGDAALWQAHVPALGAVVRVRARDARGRADEDHVEVAAAGWTPPKRTGDGSDADRVGAWPERGLCDTQLGPNRNGRQW